MCFCLPGISNFSRTLALFGLDSANNSFRSNRYFIISNYVHSMIMHIIYLIFIYEGVRKPLLEYYYIGTGISRLYIPLYVLGCPDNIFSRINENFEVRFTCFVFVMQ